MGPVESAIRAAANEGDVLHTPARRAPFKIGRITRQSITLLLGKSEAATPLTWECLEGIIPFLRRQSGEVEIGSKYDTGAKPGTLDAYLKDCIKRATAGWVGVVLEKAGLVQIIHDRPMRVRLR